MLSGMHCSDDECEIYIQFSYNFQYIQHITEFLMILYSVQTILALYFRNKNSLFGLSTRQMAGPKMCMQYANFPVEWTDRYSDPGPGPANTRLSRT